MVASEKRLCYKCYHYDTPHRQWSKNAAVWYLGCSKCGCGVFWS